MLLKEVITINYKSAQNTALEINISSPTILIGENDCGKTTSLNSTRMLLDHSFSACIPNDKSEKNDLSHTALTKSEINAHLREQGLPHLFVESDDEQNKFIVCMGKFQIEDFDKESADISNHLLWVLESARLNDDQCKYFYKARVINATTGISEIFYAHEHPDEEGLRNIYNSTQAQINSAMTAYNPSSDNLVNDNGEGRYSIYEKIRSILNTVSCTYKFVKFSDDVKQKKWKLDLQSVFPEYAYLSWNESLEGITKAANAILIDSIEAEVARAKKISGMLRTRAQTKINQRLEQLGIQNEVPSIESISAGVNFELKNQLTDLFVGKASSEDSVHIDNQGEGIKRQIWFALLKLQAEQATTTNKRYVWCFDEPETHLHPRAQRDFITTLRLLSGQHFQILVSTHSTIFVNASKLEDINTFKIENSYTNIGAIAEVEDIFDILGVLNSDFLFFNKFLIVEGNTEQALIPLLYQKHTGCTLRENNIQLINLKGCNNEGIANELLDSLINGFAKRDDISVYIFDADTNKQDDEQTFVVGKQDLEDSLPSSIWPHIVRDVYEEDIEITEQNIIDIIDSIPVAQQGSQLPANQKFAPKLRNLIRQKLDIIGEAERIDDWPNKSFDWGIIIGRHLDSSEIPEPIQRAFDALG
ncbi:ATP-dependent nuclease [Aliivibrio wodanis]|uniref:ATP-dependent nuclease n=1 Tax=Aliivibrio wodanis TaxID=80852 RepID=UPI00406C20CC